MAAAIARKPSMEFISDSVDQCYGNHKILTRHLCFSSAGGTPQASNCRGSSRRFSNAHSVKTRSKQKRGLAESRQMYGAKKALSCSLLALCRALAKAPPAQRRSTIEQLPLTLRLELIRVREAQQLNAAGTTKLKARHARSDVVVLQASYEDIRPSAPRKPCEMHAPCQKTLPKSSVKSPLACACSRPRGNVWTVRTARGVYYRVRLMLGRVLITSGRLMCNETARQLLAKLTLAASDYSLIRGCAACWRSDAEGIDVETQLNCLSAIGMTINLELSYQVVLDVRRWLGRRIYSKPFASMEEALKTRRQVMEAEGRGASALCELWWEWAQAPWHTGGRARKPSNAEAMAALNAGKRLCVGTLQCGATPEKCASHRGHSIPCRQLGGLPRCGMQMRKTRQKSPDSCGGHQYQIQKRLFTCAERAKSAFARMTSVRLRLVEGKTKDSLKESVP